MSSVGIISCATFNFESGEETMNISIVDRTDYSDVTDAPSEVTSNLLIASHTDCGLASIAVEYYVGNKICLAEYSEDSTRYIDSVKEIDGGFYIFVRDTGTTLSNLLEAILLLQILRFQMIS